MTIFTEIIEVKLPGFIIFEDEHHFAILDKYPIDTGHSLVIPKKPYEKITDMPKNEVADLFSLVPQIANAILKATGAVAFSIANSDLFFRFLIKIYLKHKMILDQACNVRFNKNF